MVRGRCGSNCAATVSNTKVAALEREIKELKAVVRGLINAVALTLASGQTELPSPHVGARPRPISLLDVWMRRHQSPAPQSSEPPPQDGHPLYPEEPEQPTEQLTDKPLATLA